MSNTRYVRSSIASARMSGAESADMAGYARSGPVIWVDEPRRASALPVLSRRAVMAALPADLPLALVAALKRA